MRIKEIRDRMDDCIIEVVELTIYTPEGDAKIVNIKTEELIELVNTIDFLKNRRES